MTDLLQRLLPNARRGSKPHCHFLTHEVPHVTATRLTELAAPFASVTDDDCWLPLGFEDCREAQLHKTSKLLPPDVAGTLRKWWLAPASERAMTPNFDVASTCTVEGTTSRGLLLVEAKAHDKELSMEAVGRRLQSNSSEARKASHGRIGGAIEEARLGLERETSLPWKISRDSTYQMSNRFAWMWKLADLGVPVVLIYLEFLQADEMTDRGSPFADHSEWERLVLTAPTSSNKVEPDTSATDFRAPEQRP